MSVVIRGATVHGKIASPAIDPLATGGTLALAQIAIGEIGRHKMGANLMARRGIGTVVASVGIATPIEATVEAAVVAPVDVHRRRLRPVQPSRLAVQTRIRRLLPSAHFGSNWRNAAKNNWPLARSAVVVARPSVKLSGRRVLASALGSAFRTMP